ncbi:MAG: hypothetical protein GC155_08735 [Alphaproteobacteria bacterium]|nr:hypothetical protein [Alphaproteobacteria bacterium]
MHKWLCGAGLALALAAPAMAQKPGDHLAKPLTGPDVKVVKEAVDTVKQPGECTVVFTIGKDGKPKDLKPTCSVDAYVPYVERAMATVTYDPEVFDGEVFETEGVKQPFSFGVQKAEASDTPPVPVVALDSGDIGRAIARVNKTGSCNMSYVVGADGVPKDVKPNCTPQRFDPWIKKAVEKMRFKPGMKDGKAVDWPLTDQPLTLTAQR